MTNRTLTLGAIATAALAAGAPSIATATEVHTATAEVACIGGLPTAAFSYVTDVPADPEPIDSSDLDHFMAEQVTIDGQVAWTFTRTVPGSEDPVIQFARASGTHTMRAFASWGGDHPGSADTGTVTVDCGPADVVTDTPELSFVPAPDHPPVFKEIPKRRIIPNCAYLRRVGAGPLTYTRLGYYPGCKVPRTIRHPRRLRHVAVAGEWKGGGR